MIGQVAVKQMASTAFRGRRLATGLAVVLAVVCGWHAIFGQNGITAYSQKRSEDRVLKAEIQKLSEENAKLKNHVDHLQSDPDAIEMEARQRLHYTRAGEVIYTLDEAQDGSRDKTSKPGTALDASSAGSALGPSALGSALRSKDASRRAAK